MDLDELHCPQFRNFDAFSDKENLTDDSYFGVGDESVSFSSSSRADNHRGKKRTSCTPCYNLRATPSRKARLSQMIADPSAFIQSYLSASLSSSITPLLSASSKSLRKKKVANEDDSISKKLFSPDSTSVSKKLFSPDSISEELLPPGVLKPQENLPRTPLLVNQSRKAEAGTEEQLLCSPIRYRKPCVRFNVSNDSADLKPYHGIQRTLTPKTNSGIAMDDILDTPDLDSGNFKPRRTILVKRLMIGTPVAGNKKSSAANMGAGKLPSKKIVSEDEFFPVHQPVKAAQKRRTNSPGGLIKKRATSTGKILGTTSKITVAKPFNFETDKRIKFSDVHQQHKKVDFVQALRKNTPKPARVLSKTKPKPFHFSVLHKAGVGEASKSVTKTLAEQVQSYLKDTPERFRSKAANSEFQPRKVSIPELVRPKTPNLQAVKRHRPVTVISHEEAEEIEVKKMKEYKFHAQPFNKRLLSGPHLEKPEVKPPTIPQDMHLETEMRTSVRKKEAPEEQPYQFHAQEMPKHIFEHPVGIKEKKPVPVTEPVSPSFALKKRSEKWNATSLTNEPEENSVFHFKADPVPSFEKPFVVKHTKKFTTARPFSFEQSDKERMVNKQRKIEEEIENERKKAEFHARPLPASVLTPRPNAMNVTKKPVTKPEPFNLLLDRLSEKKKKPILDEPVPQFKARPASITKKKPFIPKVEHKVTTAVAEPCLSTQQRAQQRLKLKERQLQEEAEKEALIAQRKKEQEEKDREEVRRLRQDLVHKANPIRNFQPVEVKPSSKPLTKPHSPKFATDLRLSNRTTLD